MNKNIKEVLDYLGREYHYMNSNDEDFIYRVLSDRYYIEVTGCRYKKTPFCVFIWAIGQERNLKIVEKSANISSLNKLKRTIDSLTKKYLTLS